MRIKNHPVSSRFKGLMNFRVTLSFTLNNTLNNLKVSLIVNFADIPMTRENAQLMGKLVIVVVQRITLNQNATRKTLNPRVGVPMVENVTTVVKLRKMLSLLKVTMTQMIWMVL